jgi:class 3 adenylate cyclase
MLTSAMTEIQVQPQVPEPRGREATIVVTDIEGSTAMNERLGDEAWLELLLTHNAILRDRVWRHGGREVGARGDGFMIVFRRAVDAVRFAISAQRLLADHAELHPEHELRVRMGIHHGLVLSEEDDICGASVQATRRITGAARGGEVLVSGVVRELLAVENVVFEDPRELLGTARVFPLRWARP